MDSLLLKRIMMSQIRLYAENTNPEYVLSRLIEVGDVLIDLQILLAEEIKNTRAKIKTKVTTKATNPVELK